MMSKQPKVLGHALTYTARRFVDGNVIVTTRQAFTNRAKSEQEARGICMDVALDTLPRSDGWYDHQTAVMELTSDMVAK